MGTAYSQTFSDKSNANHHNIPVMDHGTDWFNDNMLYSRNEHETLQLKVAIIGDEKVGKTSLINQYINHSFNRHYLPTTNINLNTYWIKHRNIDLFLYDIPGSDLNDINDLYTRLEWTMRSGINGFIAVYDVNNYKSFINIKKKLNILLKIYKDKHNVKIPSLLLGNKTDLRLNSISKSAPNTGIISGFEVETWCQHNQFNDKYDINPMILKGYKLLTNGYIRRYENMLNMSRVVLLSGINIKIPKKINNLCLKYIHNDGHYTMIQEQINCKYHNKIKRLIEKRFMDILIARYDHTMLDQSYA